MVVNNLFLEGFRNYKTLDASFDREVNVITGDNAQGKTNLVEAVYFLAAGKSFRARFDRETINFDGDFAKITADILSENREQSIEIEIYRGKGKKILVNGVKKKLVSELSGKVTCVLFSPEDLSIVRDSAAYRRRLMDMCLVQLRPRYAAFLSEYNRTYEQKLRILRDYNEKPSLLTMLDEYNERLCRLSANMIRYRAWFAENIAKYAEEIHREFSGGSEKLCIKYKTVSTIDDPKRPAAELFELVARHQAEHKDAELATGTCLTGAHKDDLIIEINGMAAKSFASQGQTRTAALSLKLAERELHFAEKNEYPILLLDDVLSELDKNRQNFVLNKIKGGQVFITCCEDDNIAARTGGKVIKIKDGGIV